MPPPVVLYVLVALALAAAGLALVAVLRRSRPHASEFDQSIAERIAALERDLARERERANQAECALAEKSGLLDGRNQSFALLEDERLRTQEAFARVRDENALLQARIATLETEALGADEKIKLLQEARETLTQQFQVLANDVLQQHGSTFAAQNKQQIDLVLQPLRDQVKDFQQGLQRAHEDLLTERAVLRHQITTMTAETTTLAQALRGNSQTQGVWGEMILSSILERSGLRENEEYVRQDSHTTEDGARLRPDVTIILPGGQRIIIDSKVSLTAFEACIAASTEDERQLHLKRHVQSLHAHIKSLSKKEYHTAAGSALDYVLMFVPIEGALAAALQCDPDITNFAVQNNVAIATPTTLMIALRTVESIWKIERRNRNADEIAERAGKMYDKFVKFLDDLTELGKRLDQAQTSYRGALGKLRDGSGNLVGQFEKIKELGARTNKALPTALLDSA